MSSLTRHCIDFHPGARRARPRAAVRFGRVLGLTALCLLVLCAAGVRVALADVSQERRSSLGIKLFRAALAADLSLKSKVDGRGELPLVLSYSADRRQAERLAERLAKGGAIRGIPVRVALSDDPGLRAYASDPPAGIFIAEPPADSALAQLIRFAREHSVLLFSPFEGHVERGVPAGMSITARVQPYINEQSLASSGIELKRLFVRASRVYP